MKEAPALHLPEAIGKIEDLPSPPGVVIEILRLSKVTCPLFTGKGVNVFLALLRKTKAFICLDTGPLHVASAAHVPTVALFGPSRPALTGPYRNRGGARVIQKILPCVPCKGMDVKCTNNICMQQITPEEVKRDRFA